MFCSETTFDPLFKMIGGISNRVVHILTGRRVYMFCCKVGMFGRGRWRSLRKSTYFLCSIAGFLILWIATNNSGQTVTCTQATCQNVPIHAKYGAIIDAVPTVNNGTGSSVQMRSNTSKQDLHGDHNLTYVKQHLLANETLQIKRTDRITEKFYKFLKKRFFVETENKRVFIFGAVVRNSSATAEWDMLSMYGQWHRSNSEQSVRCCVKLSGSQIFDIPVKKFGRTWHNNKDLKLHPWHITCHATELNFQKLKWASIVRGTHACVDSTTHYIAPYFPKRQTAGHIVITTKTAHEQLDPEALVAQLEAFKYLKVDKVMTYVEDTLWDKAKQVLGHYASTGLLEMFNYRLADVGRYPRKISKQSHQILADQITVMRDAVERSSGSTYFSIMDNDEIPTPSGYRTLKGALKRLEEKYPNASSFSLKNQHYFTDRINTSCSSNCTIFDRYQYTVPDKFNLIHKKVISYPSRILTGFLYSHHSKPRDGYYEVVCPESELFVRHYGLCERKFSKNVCSNRNAWLFNSSAATWAEKTIAANIRAMLKLLN